MGRIIRGQRKGAGSVFTSNTSKRKGEAKHRQSVRSRPSSAIVRDREAGPPEGFRLRTTPPRGPHARSPGAPLVA